MAKQVFREYCPACSNYLPLSRFLTAHYFCRSCLARIKQALRKARVDWTTSNPDKETIERITNQVVEAIQKESEGKRKKTREKWDFDHREWRVLRGRRYRTKRL